MLRIPKALSLPRTAGTLAALTLAVSGLYAITNVAHADDSITYADGDTTRAANATCNADIPGATPGYLWPTLTEYDAPAYSAIASADKSTVYFAGSPKFLSEPDQLTAVDVDTQEIIAQTDLKGIYNGDLVLQLSPDGQSIYIVASVNNRSLNFLVWDIDSWSLTGEVEIATAGSPNISIMPDGKALVVANREAFLIDPAAANLSAQSVGISGLTAQSYRAAVLTPDGTTLAILRNSDNKIVFYNTSTWETTGSVTVDVGSVTHIQWASDETLMAAVDGSIKLIDPTSLTVKGSIDGAYPSREYDMMEPLDDSRWIVGADYDPLVIEVFTLNDSETGGELSALPMPMNGGTAQKGPAGQAALVVLENLVFVGGSWANGYEIFQAAWMPLVDVIQPSTVTVPRGAESAVFDICFTGLRYDAAGAFDLTWEGSADGGETWTPMIDITTPSNSGFTTVTVPLPEYKDYLFRANWYSQFWMQQAEFPEGTEYAGIEYESSYDPVATISGEPTAGQELSANPDEFPEDSTYTYQWFMGLSTDQVSTPIDGATEATLTLTEDMVDQYVSVTITGSSESAGANLEATAEPVGPVTAGAVQPLISAAPTAVTATPTAVEGSGVTGSLIEISLPATTRAATDPICTTTVGADGKWNCKLGSTQAVGTKLNVTQTETGKLVSPAVTVVVADENTGGGSVTPTTPGTNNKPGTQGTSNKPGTNGLAATGAAGMAGALVAALALTATGVFALTRGKRQN